MHQDSYIFSYCISWKFKDAVFSLLRTRNGTFWWLKIKQLVRVSISLTLTLSFHLLTCTKIQHRAHYALFQHKTRRALIATDCKVYLTVEIPPDILSFQPPMGFFKAKDRSDWKQTGIKLACIWKRRPLSHLLLISRTLGGSKQPTLLSRMELPFPVCLIGMEMKNATPLRKSWLILKNETFYTSPHRIQMTCF